MSIKAIHTIKSKLGMTDGEYRELLMREAGVRSSRELTPEGDRAVMRALRSMEPAPASKTGQERKIWAVWLGSEDAPGLSMYLPQEKRTAAYLAGIVKRFGRVYWTGGKVCFDALTQKQASEAINALTARKDQERKKLEAVPF